MFLFVCHCCFIVIIHYSITEYSTGRNVSMEPKMSQILSYMGKELVQMILLVEVLPWWYINWLDTDFSKKSSDHWNISLLEKWKVSKYGVSPSVFGPNTGKYGPEKTPYLDIFHAVFRWLCLRVSYLSSDKWKYVWIKQLRFS